MRAYISILCNRPLTENEGYPSIGGFEVLLNTGETIAFDFTDSYLTADGPVMNWELRNLDIAAFPESIKLRKHLADIVKIKECYVDTEACDVINGVCFAPVQILAFKLSDVYDGFLENSPTIPMSTDFITVEAHSYSNNNKLLDKYDVLIDYNFTEKLCSDFIYDELLETKTVSTRFVFDFDVDVSGLDPKNINTIGLARDIALRELKNNLKNNLITFEDIALLGTSKQSVIDENS